MSVPFDVEPGGAIDGGMMPEKKKFLGILFECCNVYRRIYINMEKNAYEGRCPHCQRDVRVVIGADGSSSRFFKAR